MSHFYGTLKGTRGGATRCGTKSSGLKVIAASWFGAIRVQVWYDEATDTDRYRIEQIPWKGAGAAKHIKEGLFDE